MSVYVSGSAQNNYANITNAMYQDWLERFYPQQKQLLEQTQNGELLKQQLGRVDENFASAQKSAQLANANQMARFGVKAEANPNEQARLSLANVTTKNSLRENEQERAMSVLSGGAKGKLSQLNVGVVMGYSLLSLGADTRKRALAGMQESAQREEQREQANQSLKEAERTKRLSSVTTGAGMGMMAGMQAGSVGGPMGAAIGAAAGLILGAFLMQLDTRSAIDGAIRGFQVAEGYYQRQADNERRDKLDAREEQRYQDGQARLSQIDAKDDKRYQDDIEYRNAQTEKEEQRYQDGLKQEGKDRAQRNRLLDVQIDAHKSANELSQYQLNQQKKMAYMQENLPLIQSGLKRYMETGELDPLFEQEHIKGSAYDPRRYTPRVVQAAFDIESTMPKVLDGSISYKDSQFTKSMGVLLERNVKQGIGDKDPESGKVIKDKEYLRHDFVADIDPNREGDQPGVVVGLKVTYEDGTTKTAPVTESRLAGGNEAVKVIPLDALMKDVTGQIHMAKQFFSNDHYANLFNVDDAEIDKQWREAVTDVEKDRTKAINELMDPTPEQVAALNARFDERRASIDQVYGRVGVGQDSAKGGANSAVAWAGNDPQKQQFISELSQSMDVAALAPEALEHNYNKALGLKAKQAQEQKKQQQLAQLRQQKVDRANANAVVYTPDDDGMPSSEQSQPVSSLKDLIYADY